MKKTVSIIPDHQSGLILVGEISWHGATFLWVNENQHIEGIEDFVFDEEQGPSKDEQLANIIITFINTGFKEKHLFYNFSESVLIPVKFYSEGTASSIHSAIHESEGALLLNETNDGIVNVYAVPPIIHEAVKETGFSWKHSGSCQQRLEDGIHCIFYNNAVKVIVNQYGRLQFNQQFAFSNSQEAAYHILNTCRQHQLDPAEERMFLSGMISTDSPLYNELHRYFAGLQLAKAENSFTKHQELSAYPDHFFHHLISLAKCVL